MISHFLLHQGIFVQKQHDYHPPPPHSSNLAPSNVYLFPGLKMKLKGCHVDTIEVIEAESQAVFNTLREHGFQDAFKTLEKRWCIRAEGDYFYDDDQPDDSTSPGNYGH
jgi:hypothetical protein